MATTTPAYRFEPLAGWVGRLNCPVRCGAAIPTATPGRLLMCQAAGEWQVYRPEGGRYVPSIACCGACKAAMEEPE